MRLPVPGNMAQSIGMMLQSLLFIVGSLGGVANAPEGEVVQPQIVVPGEWLVDKEEHFLFLPLNMPKDMPLDECKVMSNGEQILVVVTEKPKDKEDSPAVKKFKMIMEALKKEVGYDEREMKAKLQSWYETEDDPEVEEMVGEALDHLTKVRDAKKHSEGKRLSVPLGMLVKEAAQTLRGMSTGGLQTLNLTSTQISTAAQSFLARAARHTALSVVQPPAAGSTGELPEVQQAERVLPSLHKAHFTKRVGIIKESFAIEIPYPVPTDKVFIIQSKNSLMVTMPLIRKSLEAKGISTGGKPFLRTPVFDTSGKHVAGPNSVQLDNAAARLHLDHVNAVNPLIPLPE